MTGKNNIRNEVLPVLLLLETTKRHLGARNVLLGVLEVREEGVLVPGDALLLVGIGVGVALDGASLAAEKTVQSRSNLVAAVLLDSVALSTTALEHLDTLGNVTCGGKKKKKKNVVSEPYLEKRNPRI